MLQSWRQSFTKHSRDSILPSLFGDKKPQAFGQSGVAVFGGVLSSNLLCGMVALMVFLSGLAMSTSLVLDALADRWTNELQYSLTLEILPPEDALPLIGLMEKGQTMETSDAVIKTTINPLNHEQRIAKTLEIAKSVQGVLNVRRIPNQELNKLLEPWLGSAEALQDITMPALIAVELDPTFTDTESRLEKQLSESGFTININKHTLWLNDLQTLNKTMQWLGYCILLVLGLVAVVGVMVATQSRIVTHAETLELLHTMGASDAMLSDLVQWQTLRTSLFGAVIGFLGVIMIHGVFSVIGMQVQTLLLPDFHIDALAFAAIASVPVWGILLATMTARWTVLLHLHKLP